MWLQFPKLRVQEESVSGGDFSKQCEEGEERCTQNEKLTFALFLVLVLFLVRALYFTLTVFRITMTSC